jgi:hypothetical protein
MRRSTSSLLYYFIKVILYYLIKVILYYFIKVEATPPKQTLEDHLQNAPANNPAAGSKPQSTVLSVSGRQRLQS